MASELANTGNGNMPASTPPNGSMQAAEQQLFDLGDTDSEPEAIFILGAPRTGSTLLYQAMASAFALPFISNFTNAHFPAHPILGLAIQTAMSPEISFSSSFGKTAAPFEPSEGSAVMTAWFGGGHPSQVTSARILPGRESHFLSTLRAVEALYRRPLLTKNAWNCFRAEYLASALPRAKFIWIRRDIEDAALSDLNARYVTKSDPSAWNSATPANHQDLLRRPPVEQVIENQFEYNSALQRSLARVGDGKHSVIWYEDFVRDPRSILSAIALLLGKTMNDVRPDMIGQPGNLDRVSADELQALRKYLAVNSARLATSRYQTRG